jgi:multidrug efflux pump subunit AcrB
MNISSHFIKRPVMTCLVMAAFMLAGVFGYFASGERASER